MKEYKGFVAKHPDGHFVMRTFCENKESVYKKLAQLGVDRSLADSWGFELFPAKFVIDAPSGREE